MVRPVSAAEKRRPLRTRRRAGPGWVDNRPKDGALWLHKPVAPGTPLPGWARATVGLRPGQPWTRRRGAARDLVRELEIFWAEQGVA